MLTKDELKKFLDGKWDVYLENIREAFPKESPIKILELVVELEKEDWLSVSYCNEHKRFEIDPTADRIK